MAEYIILPMLGQTMETGTISKWLVKEGDAVKEGQDIFDLESDKLTNTETAARGGVIRKILVPEGEEVPVLSRVAIIGDANEDVSAMLSESGVKCPPAFAAASEEPKAQKAADLAAERIIASPRAKKFASENDIDLSLVKGTGPGGRIVEKDVEKYLLYAISMDTAPAPKSVPEPEKPASAVPTDKKAPLKAEKSAEAAKVLRPDEEIKPMNGMRRAIANNMLKSVRTSPTVTYTISVDMTNIKAFREQLKANGLKVSYTDILVKFVAKALLDFPIVNGSIDGDNIIYKHYVNMGVAVALNDGLIVPNVKNADKKGLMQISREIGELAEKARSGRLTLDDYTGGTFTITNLGMYGIESFTPIINQPESAILGVNAMADRPVFNEEGELVRKTFMPLSLTADHRSIDGAVAAQFLHRVKTLLENPALMEA
ncbi:MAG: 2-oxo acid dehydrogenase subunit E2 [Clostridia bacterium]|nr:2-oxo acid dehydrogenase subunit E2 [Clostridia bacterium]